LDTNCLFRHGVENYFHCPGAEATSLSTLASSMIGVLNALCGTRRALVKCTHDVLLKDSCPLLPASQAVVEILQSVKPDVLVIAPCQGLKEAGYMFAWTILIRKIVAKPLLYFADIIKGDVKFIPRERQAALTGRGRLKDSGPSGGKLKSLYPCAGAWASLPFRCSQRPCFLAGPLRSLAPGAKRLKDHHD
jgi:c-di-GMP-related signal transduction protein